MSQEKVDKYKNYKNNRDKIQKKEARELLLEKIIVSAVCLLIVVWIGYSAYGLATKDDAGRGHNYRNERDSHDRLSPGAYCRRDSRIGIQGRQNGKC